MKCDHTLGLCVLNAKSGDKLPPVFREIDHGFNAAAGAADEVAQDVRPPVTDSGLSDDERFLGGKGGAVHGAQNLANAMRTAQAVYRLGLRSGGKSAPQFWI